MVEHSLSQKPAPGKAKLVMIPVLGAVLLYMIVSPSNEVAPPVQLARTSPPQTSAPVASSTALGTTSVSKVMPQAAGWPASEASAKSGNASTTALVTWPATPLAEVLAVNPFKMPAEFVPTVTVTQTPVVPQTLVENRKELDAEKAADLQAAVKGQRLAAIVRTSKGVGAIVGDNVVNVGDLIGERLRVTAIRPEGVEVELIDKPTAGERQVSE